MNKIWGKIPNIFAVVYDTNLEKKQSIYKICLDKKIQAMESPQGKRADMFAVFDRGSKHSSRLRMRWLKNFPPGSRNLAI